MYPDPAEKKHYQILDLDFEHKSISIIRIPRGYIYIYFCTGIALHGLFP